MFIVCLAGHALTSATYSSERTTRARAYRYSAKVSSHLSHCGNLRGQSRLEPREKLSWDVGNGSRQIVERKSILSRDRKLDNELALTTERHWFHSWRGNPSARNYQFRDGLFGSASRARQILTNLLGISFLVLLSFISFYFFCMEKERLKYVSENSAWYRSENNVEPLKYN